MRTFIIVISVFMMIIILAAIFTLFSTIEAVIGNRSRPRPSRFPTRYG